ncbi:hypothetical protein [Shewanella waksmanii]|uniref:hypothetical protein n=1 Tax=Shewanella waksmanii TaxID=213783 RepID=UPI00048EAD8E|nr:hypothetical protein [Shewanella waksmanii]
MNYFFRFYVHDLIVIISLVVILMVQVFLSFDVASKEYNADSIFSELVNLVGKWEAVSPNGHYHTVTYELISNETALVEKWELGDNRTSMTVYHKSGGKLYATHFCPHGNVIKLVLKDKNVIGNNIFEYLDGSNVIGVKGEHQHYFTVNLSLPDMFSRSEVYVNNILVNSNSINNDADFVIYSRVKESQ